MDGNDDLARELLSAIRKLPAEPQPVIPPPPDLAGQVATLIARAAANQERPVTVADAKPRWDPTINLGQVLTLGTFIFLISGVLWHFSQTQANIQKDIEAGNTRAARYIPIIETVSKMNDIQDQRIGNLSDTVIEIRRQNAETSSLLGTIREDLATIKTRLAIEGRPR